MSVPLPLLSQSHFRHALLRAGVGHSTPANKGLLVTVSITMSIVINDVTCSLSITRSFLIQPEDFCVLKFSRQVDGLKNRSGLGHSLLETVDPLFLRSISTQYLSIHPLRYVQ